ncbi:MAG: PLP-dependent aminotransferase family protein [Clostridia bacterium]|nr:PLP-dependent aminotransferase family protein [Clostridia bacterium]
MDFSFSDRVASLKPSAIREILKFSSLPGMIPFSAGNPAVETFPAKEVADITAKLLSEKPGDVLQYSVTEGYTPLRDALKQRMAEKYDSFKESDELIITSGAQQVMELTTKSLCNEGDTIICENPSFIGSLNAFRSYNVKLCGIDVLSDGMDMDMLEEALKREKKAKFIYTIPNFQNPSGVTMSAEKRVRLYELAKKYNVPILEDNPYGDLRFAGQDIPTIKSLDTDGLVIYAGTFSKVLSPGLRVGYAIAPKELMPKLIVCKQVSDVHTCLLSQMIAFEFMTKYDFDGHLEKNRGIYRKKAQLMMDNMDQKLLDHLSYNKIEGGLFIWCTLPESVDMLALCKKGIEKGVAVVPGNAFAMDDTLVNHNIRLNFSTPTDQQIVDGIEILANLFK